ncbi:atp4 subunit B of the stator stalk of mitochondrial F1F0 ATP synthase [Ascosphaera aggregata]|nr:atp4 subunit B of the stator stalk of mitochondrial F1F0 ATP synthase [Ascosphaera aggregata]
MASQLLKSAFGAASVRPSVTCIRALPALSQPLQLTRAASNVSAQSEEQSCTFIDSIPGNSLVSKAAILSASAGVSIAAISNELYVMNEETVIAISLLSVFYGVARLGGPAWTAFANSEIKKHTDSLTTARAEHTNAVKQRIEDVKQLEGVVDITKQLFEVSKETAALEAQAYELEQRTALAAEAKRVLDSWVSYESQMKQREQRQLAESVISKIKAELQNPKTLQQILNQSIADVERIVAKGAPAISSAVCIHGANIQIPTSSMPGEKYDLTAPRFSIDEITGASFNHGLSEGPQVRIDPAGAVANEAETPPLPTNSTEAQSSGDTSILGRRRRRLSSLFHRSHQSKTTPADGSALHYIPEPEKDGVRGPRRLSQRLLGEHNGNRQESANIPRDLLQVPSATRDNQAQAEEQWEKHAAQLLFASPSPQGSDKSYFELSRQPSRTLSASPSAASGHLGSSNNEITDLAERLVLLDIAQSTQMFQTLADPAGANEPIAQVFYGLAKRHGWGCTMDPREAFRFLRMGAANAALLSEETVSKGFKQGTYARKVLAMAIYELANSYRNAWGTSKDPVAARHYYETAANLGDTDAMCEAAWCFEKGFGGKKDKVSIFPSLLEATVPA